MVVATIAALYLGIRANFDPTIGPARLIYAFEAVIIGGLGSLWGTLAGGIIIGVAQTVGAAHQSGMADPGRPSRLSGRARAPAARPVSARGGLSDGRRDGSDRQRAIASRPGPARRRCWRSPASRWSSLLAALPAVRRPRR